MKKKHALKIVIALLIIILGLIYINVNREYKPALTYIDAIEKVYNSNIHGMSIGVFKTEDLYDENVEIIYTATGDKYNNFSENSKEGVKIWEVKQLFLNIKSLKVVKEGLPKIPKSQDMVNYIIESNQDFSGKDTDKGIYHLTVYVNSKNYHIYIPHYYESNNSLNQVAEYVEYEPNEITKKLVNDIISQ
ncbi:hypothetical protein HMPREF1982_02149 [Clostridiales bacterium oral taxon 876 str. F0540]|nr:hypothetical protein HMPREF1982_02149 [Clostridiales bacterium oral taxon 876 str. F0540]